MRRLPSIRCIGAVVAAMSLVGACDDDETLSLDQAADVDDGAVVIGDEGGAGGPFGTADVSFDGVTASVGGVSCSNEARLVVTPIVSDSFTLAVDGDPQGDEWTIRVVQPGDPEIVWTAIEPAVDLDGDTLAGSAQMQRADDPSVTAALAFVVDC